MNVEITGAKILFELPFGLTITETQVNSWIIMAVITLLCIWLTRGLKVHATSKKQIVAELLVQKCQGFVNENMGCKFSGFVPLIAAIFSLSLLSSLCSLLTMYPPTADLNTTLGWAALVFFMITFYKIKTNGILGYGKSLTKPFAVMTPFNIIGEFSTPISMAFRHFGNIATGVVISTLLYAGLQVASNAALGMLPGFLADIPIFQLGLPAVLSIYFDVFTSVLQAFIFCMLTMLYISTAAQADE